MKPPILTPYQRALLLLYRSYLQEPPTVAQLLKGAVRNYAFIGLLVTIAAALLILSGLGSYLLVGLAALIGVVLRDIGHMTRFIVAWPVFRKVIDWQLVDELLTESDSISAPNDHQRF